MSSTIGHLLCCSRITNLPHVLLRNMLTALPTHSTQRIFIHNPRTTRCLNASKAILWQDWVAHVLPSAHIFEGDRVYTLVLAYIISSLGIAGVLCASQNAVQSVSSMYSQWEVSRFAQKPVNKQLFWDNSNSNYRVIRVSAVDHSSDYTCVCH